MPKTTKEIRRSEVLLRDGDTLWFSQFEVDELKEKLKECVSNVCETEDFVVMENLFRNHLVEFQDFEISNNYVKKVISKKIDSVFDEVTKK